MIGVPDDKRNKFNNISSSLVHSTMTGIGSCAALLFTDVQTDFIHGQSNLAFTLLNISLGYFMFDIVDTLVAFNFSFEDLPNFSVGKNGHAHRILRTRLGIEQLLDAQFESVLVDFFQFEN